LSLVILRCFSTRMLRSRGIYIFVYLQFWHRRRLPPLWVPRTTTRIPSFLGLKLPSISWDIFFGSLRFDITLCLLNSGLWGRRRTRILTCLMTSSPSPAVPSDLFFVPIVNVHLVIVIVIIERVSIITVIVTVSSSTSR
jgi:hypothetical protein